MSAKAAFTPQNLDFGGAPPGSAGPDVTVNPNVLEVFPEAISFTGGVQISTAPAAANVTAAITNDSGPVFHVRDVTVLGFVMREIDPSELPPGFKGKIPKVRVLVPLGQADGLTPLAVNAGQMVLVRVAFVVPGEGGVFKGALAIQGDTWDRIDIPLSLFSSAVSSTVLNAPVSLSQGQATDMTIEFKVVAGPETNVRYAMSGTQIHTGVTFVGETEFHATAVAQRRLLRVFTAIDAPLGDNTLAIEQHAQNRSSFLLPVTVNADPEPDIARAAIARKAAERADVLGRATDVVKPVLRSGTPVPGSFFQHFEHGDVYFSPDSLAHEVHGDIKIKYDETGGPEGVLGFPITDVSLGADGRGRFIDFPGASIYSHPDIGPRVVSDPIRGFWRSQQAETGALGYPVRDHHILRNTAHLDFPNPNGVSWGTFENGAIINSDEGTFNVPVVPTSPATEQEALDGLKRLVHKKFGEEFQKSPDNVGLHKEIEILSALPVDFDLQQSTGRATLFRLHGFHDNGLIADTDFTIDIGIRIGWKLELLDGETRRLIASLVPGSLVITVDGPGEDQIRAALTNKITATFAGGISLSDLPITFHLAKNGHDSAVILTVIDTLVGTDGGLRLLVNPEQRSIFPQGAFGPEILSKVETEFLAFLSGTTP